MRETEGGPAGIANHRTLTEGRREEEASPRDAETPSASEGASAETGTRE
ncbi:hypothetical protein EFA46_000205 [Halarchaeum sp. CBA1220]|nr:hypothetical protein [Halarchaeum sp. CBA1220]QLC32694.1 hypothetical protein EFA46_000205 [Halarchaeum sp. CBA1220]